MTVRMIRTAVLVATLLLLLLPPGKAPLAHAQGGVGADTLIARMNAIELVDRWQADGIVTIVNGASLRRRTVRISVMRQGQTTRSYRRYSFVRPADISGTAILVHENSGADNDLWLYLPALGRARRLTSSRLGASFAGTDFAYVDLMPLKTEKYRHRILSEGMRGGQPFAVVDSRPIDPTYARDTGYGAIRSFIAATGIPFRIEYDGVDGKPLKIQEIRDPIAAPGGRYIMGRRTMTVVAGETGSPRNTVLTLANVGFAPPIGANDFTSERLSN